MVQFDNAASYPFNVTGTEPGDVVSDIQATLYISTEWPELSFTAMNGSNPAWTIPVLTGENVNIEGKSYRGYVTN